MKLYRDFYNKYGDKTIGDPNEGKFFIHHGRIIITEKNIDKEVQNCYFSTANENDFVFCLFGINPKEHDSFIFSEEQKTKLINFHDKALLITDPLEFYNRLKTAAVKRGLDMTNAFVRYYDPSVDDVGRLCELVVCGNKSIVYYKTKDYEYQQEFRFAIPNTTGEDYIDLQIGDISDITREFTTKEILYNSYINKNIK